MVRMNPERVLPCGMPVLLGSSDTDHTSYGVTASRIYNNAPFRVRVLFQQPFAHLYQHDHMPASLVWILGLAMYYWADSARTVIPERG